MTAIAGMFTSCSNDAIEIISTDIIDPNVKQVADVSITINPETAVGGFTGYVQNVDELKTLSTMMGSEPRLKVCMLLYKDGKLIEEKTDYAEKYNTKMTSHHQLEHGKYTVVGYSYIVTPKDGSYADYVWSIKDKENLSSLNFFTESGTGLRSVYAILGITVKDIEVSSNGKDYVVDVQPAGAVIYVISTNCKDIDMSIYDHTPDAFGVLYDRKVNSIDIRNNELLTSYENSEGNRRYWLARTTKTTMDSGTGSTFITACFIPTGDQVSKITFIPGYRYTTDDQQYYGPFGAQEYALDLKAGDEYLIEMNLKTGASKCQEFKNQKYQ